MKTNRFGQLLAGSGLMMNMAMGQASVEVGSVRVQALGEHLLRVEQRGPAGFEDRPTFTVLDRTPGGTVLQETRGPVHTTLTTKNARLVVPNDATGLEGIRVESSAGELLCVLSNDAIHTPSYLPSPSDLPPVWVMGDAPRIIPPERGALPPEPGSDEQASGWDLDNDAPDAYIFSPAASGYETFRKDFLRLTGAVPQVPLYTLGLWYSRYYPYTEEDALAVIDRFREADFPLDVFVVDTDWRVGASCGYEINTDLFPDMARFIRRAHEKDVRIMLNDHPEPRGTHALDPAELSFRRDGLRSLLDLGADLWWFDRNWHTCLYPLAPGLEKEVWGMRLYHDIVQEARPDRRPLILSNVDGINNGRRDAPSHPASHRFPVWWTGDTLGEWSALSSGIRNGVNSGLDSLMPYVHEDLGGHHGQPDAELYIRFMQFGALSPVARIHCGNQVHRYPWAYGKEAEQIVGEFFRLRYRLLPMLYAAAVEAHNSGLPLLRRGDLEWPGFSEAADSTQYLFGEDLLIAPILAPAPKKGKPAERTVWIPPGRWQDAWSGKVHTGPATLRATSALKEIPIFIRQGGIVWNIPQRKTTGPAVWPDLSADVWIPEEDQEQVRWLVEDDGISTAYQTGAMARTECRLVRRGEETRLRLIPHPAPEGVRPGSRRLTLRLHLPPESHMKASSFQGSPLEAGDFTRLSPSGDRLPRLFAGAGARPPAHAGIVLEWTGTVDAAETLEWILRTEPGG